MQASIKPVTFCIRTHLNPHGRKFISGIEMGIGVSLVKILQEGLDESKMEE